MRRVLGVLLLLLPVAVPWLVVGQEIWERTPIDLNTGVALNTGVVAWFPGLRHLGGGPKWYDWSNRTVGTLTSGAAWGPPTCPGAEGEIRLNGTTAYVHAGTPLAVQDLVGFTVVARVRLTGFGGANLGAIVTKRSAGGWRFNVNNSSVTNGLQFIADWSVDIGNWSLDSVVSTGNCYTLGVVYDGSSPSNVPTFYVDGFAFAPTLLTSNPAGTLTPDTTSVLCLGDEDCPGNKFFAGALLDVRVYNRLLDANAMLALHLALSAPGGYAGLFVPQLDLGAVGTVAAPVAGIGVRRRLHIFQ